MKNVNIKQKVMWYAWLLYNDSKLPFMFSRTFSDCLEEAWATIKRYY